MKGRHGNAQCWMALMSAPAVLLGALVMAVGGISVRIWALNILVWVSMAVLCVLYIHWREWFELKKWSVQNVSFVTLAWLFSTICFPSTEGVHRWLYLGPIRLYAAAIFLPALLIVLSWLLVKGLKTMAFTLTLSVAALLAYQPDAAQGAAFALSAGWLLVRSPNLSRTASSFVSGALLICAILAWLKPDPLPAVEYVEGVVGMAARISHGLAILCVGALAMLPMPFVWESLRSREQCDADLGIAFAAYFGATLLGSALGNFPVPMMGYGASPIIGYFIAVGSLANRKLNGPVPDVRSGLPVL